MSVWEQLVVFREKIKNKECFKGIPYNYFYDEDEIYDAMESGCIPAFAEELGIDPDAEIWEIVGLVDHKNLFEDGEIAWDEEGRAWYRNICYNDYVWVRDPKHDKNNNINKKEGENE